MMGTDAQFKDIKFVRRFTKKNIIKTLFKFCLSCLTKKFRGIKLLLIPRKLLFHISTNAHYNYINIIIIGIHYRYRMILNKTYNNIILNLYKFLLFSQQWEIILQLYQKNTHRNLKKIFLIFLHTDFLITLTVLLLLFFVIRCTYHWRN